MLQKCRWALCPPHSRIVLIDLTTKVKSRFIRNRHVARIPFYGGLGRVLGGLTQNLRGSGVQIDVLSGNHKTKSAVNFRLLTLTKEAPKKRNRNVRVTNT